MEDSDYGCFLCKRGTMVAFEGKTGHISSDHSDYGCFRSPIYFLRQNSQKWKARSHFWTRISM